MLSFVFVLHNSGVEQSVVVRIVVRREMKKTILGGLDPVVGIGVICFILFLSKYNDK